MDRQISKGWEERGKDVFMWPSAKECICMWYLSLKREEPSFPYESLKQTFGQNLLIKLYLRVNLIAIINVISD